MKALATVLIFSLLFVTLIAKPSNEDCIGNYRPCVTHSDCCFGCCSNERCYPHGEECNKDNNPCLLHECPPGKVCYLQKVQCIQAPCPPIPSCKTNDPDYY